MPIEENRSFRRLRNQVKSFSVLDDNPEVLRLLGATGGCHRSVTEEGSRTRAAGFPPDARAR